ncbi:TIGR01244 family sulfur transferase [Paracoccus sp. TK19116]|uniref:TIGR01244 family sulfur transferase n=1 Tax=Paracoccus albicereus TaxID=2922394 RepID=A0ABT1MNW5_9RHOB|nr:TIGR01244 family sulfur transferase [Paracoccus albicereus]MCQ0969977.1 TIGR01244 family sulfur transferase [Paracoccus albicereus]
MDLRQLTPALAVSPQLSLSDIPELSKAGFRVLINNRPDDEIGPDIDHEAMGQAAKAHGMRYHYLPFTPGQITPRLIADFSEAMAGRGPHIAYCRSGHRCTVLWALTQAGKRPEAEILETATQAGYDLEPIRPLIASLASKR